MNIFLETLQKEMESKFIKISELSRRIGSPDSTVRGWFAKDSFPSVELAYRVSKALGVNIEYLMTGDKSQLIPAEKKPLVICNYTAEEEQLLRAYQALDESDKRLFIGFLNLLSHKEDV